MSEDRSSETTFKRLCDIFETLHKAIDESFIVSRHEGGVVESCHQDDCECFQCVIRAAVLDLEHVLADIEAQTTKPNDPKCMQCKNRVPGFPYAAKGVCFFCSGTGGYNRFEPKDEKKEENDGEA